MRRSARPPVRPSAVVGCALAAQLAGCNPASTRPSLSPLPEARTVEIEAKVPQATERMAKELRAQRIPVTRVEPRDGWFETPWFDAESGDSTAAPPLGAGVVKLRGWVGPGRPKHSEATVELVYRDRVDPSLPWRELERAVPSDAGVAKRVGEVLEIFEPRKGIEPLPADSTAPARRAPDGRGPGAPAVRPDSARARPGIAPADADSAPPRPTGRP
ncbi:MAG: hypothetical protein NW201_03025 [Gemmatimonadales bacterium]|nr:hypothetical protein [Gemmatimonadales bacterium]